MTPPLDGVLVVSVEQAIAAPFATRQLADLGAEVLKIERPGEGDFARHYDTAVGGSSSFFVWGNRGKQSIELDIKDPDDRRRLDELIAGADVFVQNLSPAAADRLGILADQLRTRRSDLIACDISGYGLDGPRTDDKAYDLAVQAEAGAIALTGTPEQATKIGFSVADIATAMYAFSSILAALYRRQATGEGASIDISMLESLAEWTSGPTFYAVGTGSVPPRSGHRHTMIAPYGLYALADGSDVLIAVQSNRGWADFVTHVLDDATLVDDPRFATNPDRIANVEDLEAIINAHFRSRPADEILAALARGRVTHSRVNDPLALWQHEQLRARGRFMTIPTPTGEAEVYRPPFNLSGLDDDPSAVPTLGIDTTDLARRLIERGQRRDG